MFNLTRITVWAAISLVFLACGGRGSHRQAGYSDTLYMPRYAGGFAIYSCPGGSVVAITNPWQGAEEVRTDVFLSREGALPPEGFEGVVLPCPLRKVVCMSSSYVAFIDCLGAVDIVEGISGARYVSNPVIQGRFAAGEVREVGYDSNVNFELIASIAPDVVLAYGVAGENPILSRKLRELGINLIYIGDYVEQSPLGKAEWLVVFGEMLGVREQAVVEFGRICDAYNELRDRVEESLSAEDGGKPDGGKPGGGLPGGAKKSGLPATAGKDRRPVVMFNSPWRDSWFVPGDRSYMVRLVDDAGAVYACAGVDSDKSRPISTETAYVYLSGSDFWFNPNDAATLGQLVAANPRFADAAPVRSGGVYNNNLRITPAGGSDFWESGAVRPDVVLRDMVRIFHPELASGHELYYFRRLE